MKLSLTAVLAAAALGLSCGECHPVRLRAKQPAPPPASALASAPRGHYVEARTASVLAGACHYGGEATTQGREALLAWSFEGGAWRGRELAGSKVVAVVAGESNLAEGGARRSVLYADGRNREAALALVRERYGDALGNVVRVVEAPIDARFSDEGYAVAIEGVAELSGEKLPDRACCAMPQSVWYAPIGEVAGRVVGQSRVFRYADESLGPVWSRADHNDAFVGAIAIAR
jgi:hypothetical protein